MKCEEIGTELKRIRYEKGMTLKEVAKQTMYSEHHICIIENRNKKLSIYSLCDLLDAYEMEIAFVPKVQNANTLDEGKLIDEVVEYLIRNVITLDGYDIALIKGHAKRLKKEKGLLNDEADD